MSPRRQARRQAPGPGPAASAGPRQTRTQPATGPGAGAGSPPGLALAAAPEPRYRRRYRDRGSVARTASDRADSVSESRAAAPGWGARRRPAQPSGSVLVSLSSRAAAGRGPPGGSVSERRNYLRLSGHAVTVLRRRRVRPSANLEPPRCSDM